MKKQKIVAFDILGPMYHYDGAQGWKEDEGAVKTLLDIFKKFGYDPKTGEEEAQAEEQIFEKGQAQVSITPGFVETVLYTHQNRALPVIISAGSPGAFEFVLEEAVRDYKNRTGETISVNQLFPEEHRHSTVPVGSKKKPETWATVAARYGQADVLTTYEDTFANMQAAMQGMNCEGYFVVAQPSGLVTLEKRIHKGTMQELLPQLKEKLK
jgi:hypothetical protein